MVPPKLSSQTQMTFPPMGPPPCSFLQSSHSQCRRVRLRRLRKKPQIECVSQCGRKGEAYTPQPEPLSFNLSKRQRVN